MNKDMKSMYELYASGLSTTDIAKIYGYKTGKSIGDKLKKAGYKLRTSRQSRNLKRKYNEHMLRVIDAPWKGYFLGLLLTDGWVTRGRDVCLGQVDKEVIEFLSTCTGQLFSVVPAGKKIGPQGKEVNCQESYRLNFSSSVLYNDVQRLGVVPNKTNHVPQIVLDIEEMIYLKDIIRGVIDGDGTFGFPSNVPGTAYCRIVSKSEHFLCQVATWLAILGFEKVKVKPLSHANEMHQIEICGKDNMKLMKYSIYRRDYGMKKKRQKLYCRLSE